MRLSKDARLNDHLVLQTIGGAVGFLIASRPPKHTAQMQLAAKGNDWASFYYKGPLGPLASMRLFSSVGVVLAPIRPEGLPAWEEVRARLDQSLAEGVIGLVGELDNPITFRVSPLRFGRWELRDRLASDYGWINDPSNWQINLEVMGPYLAAQVGDLHFSHRLVSLTKGPSSTNSVVASLMVSLIKPLPGEVIFDAFCGMGTLVFEILDTSPATFVIGSDFSRRAIETASGNLNKIESNLYALLVADASRLPLRSGQVEAAISNLPFGKRAGSHRINASLYSSFFRELHRVLTKSGRAVLLTEEKRVLRQAVGASGMAVYAEHVITVGGLHPTIFIVGKRQANAMG